MGRSIDEVAKQKSGDPVTGGKLSASGSVRRSSDVVWNKNESSFQICPRMIKFFPLKCIGFCFVLFLVYS